LDRSLNNSTISKMGSTKIDTQNMMVNKSIKISQNLDTLNDYSKLSTTYHEYIKGNDITNGIENRRSSSKKKFK